MSNNETVEKGTGVVTALGSLDRFTAQFFDTSFISEIVGTGDALTIVVAGIGISAIVYFASLLNVVDFDDL